MQLQQADQRTESHLESLLRDFESKNENLEAISNRMLEHGHRLENTNLPEENGKSVDPKRFNDGLLYRFESALKKYDSLLTVLNKTEKKIGEIA